MLKEINFKEYLKQGIEMEKTNPLQKQKYYQIWVKKSVSPVDYRNIYSQNSSYCLLGKDQKNMWVGFLTGSVDPNYIPTNCQLLEDDELMQVDNYRRAKNIRPFPCEKEGDN